MKLISRAEGGWNVRMSVAGRRQGRFFADSKFGTKKAALAAARVYRDALLAQKAARPRRLPKPLLVVRGSTTCYQIRLPKPGRGTTCTEFSVAKHGPRAAKRMAVEALAAAILNCH